MYLETFSIQLITLEFFTIFLQTAADFVTLPVAIGHEPTGSQISSVSSI